MSFWLVMIGLLVRKVHFQDLAEGVGTEPGMIQVNETEREWKEIYLKGKKVGYAVNMIKPFEEGYFIREEIFLRLNLMGLGSGMYTVTQSRMDQRFFLKSFEFSVVSGVVRFNVHGAVKGDRLVLETGRGKDKRTQSIALAGPPVIGAGMSHFFRSREIHVGDLFQFPLFDPSSMTQKDVVVRVKARETLTINGISYKAFRLETELWGKVISFWLDENGAVLKEEGFMGFTMIRSSAARAPEDLEGERGVDIYEMTAVKADKDLPAAERLNFLKLRIAGIEPTSLSGKALHGGRQRFREGVMELTKEVIPSRASYTLPHGGTGGLKPYLQPEFNIETDAREIREKAREIVGGDRSPLFAARKLMNWVYRNLQKRPVLSLPSALEVLRTGVGDCNEHATLMVALLRASGIPARISIGLVYTRGKFFYHAWTEAYLGDWISMDATLNQIPADVTHIKLMEGNLDKQVEIAGLIGQIGLEVLDYRYD